MFFSLGKILKSRIEQSGFKNKIFETEVCRMWDSVIEELFRDEPKLKKKISDETRTLYFKKGILYVSGPKNQSLKQEIFFYKNVLKESFNKKLKKEAVKEIVFKG